MKKLNAIAILLIVMVCLVGCGSSKPAKLRKIELPAQIIGNWIVKDPPKTDTDTTPNNTPTPPSYILSFTPDETFTLNLDGKSFQGTYIISGTTIQLIPTGKNYRFEVGATEKEDKVIGDKLTWARATNQPDYTPDENTPTPTSDEPLTPDEPITPVPTPDFPVPPPPPDVI